MPLTASISSLLDSHTHKHNVCSTFSWKYSKAPRGRRRRAEVWLLLFQARPAHNRPQWERGQCRPRSGREVECDTS